MVCTSSHRRGWLKAVRPGSKVTEHGGLSTTFAACRISSGSRHWEGRYRLPAPRDTCSHCDDVLELARQLASLHSGISVTSYDFEKHSSRAEESNITLAPTTIVRGNQRSIRLVGLFSGLLFPVLLDIIWLVSQGRAPFTDEQRTILTDLTKDEIEIEAIITPYDPYSAHMALSLIHIYEPTRRTPI